MSIFVVFQSIYVLVDDLLTMEKPLEQVPVTWPKSRSNSILTDSIFFLFASTFISYRRHLLLFSFVVILTV